MIAWPFLSATALAVATLAVSAAVRLPPELVWNATASAPRGLYLAHPPRDLKRSDFVLVMPPRRIARLAAKRGYLPLGVPLVKRIAARSGDRICACGLAISINGRVVAHRLKQDRAGRALPAWHGCHTLGAGAIFPLMVHVPESFDGRYFGPVRRTAILAKLTPLWTF